MTECSNRKGDRLKKDAPRRGQEQEAMSGRAKSQGGENILQSFRIWRQGISRVFHTLTSCSAILQKVRALIAESPTNFTAICVGKEESLAKVMHRRNFTFSRNPQ